MDNCPYCKMLSGEIPASIVYRDQHCAAALSLQPINPGHLFILPRDHLQGLDDLSPDLSTHLFQVARKMAKALKESGLECEGVNLFLADGKAAQQTIPHLHLHVIPRTAGDGFAFKFSPRHAELPTREELKKNAQLLQEVLEKNND